MSAVCNCVQTLRHRQWAAGRCTSGRPHSRLHPARYNADIGYSTCLRPQNRFNQRTAIRLEALIIFIRSGVIIAISPQGQNRIPLPAASLFPRPKRRHLRQCGAVRPPARRRRSYSAFLFCILHQVRNVRIETVALDPDIGKHLAGLDLVGRHGIDIGQINCGGNLFHAGQCSEVIL